MSDLTIIYLNGNQHPENWKDYQRRFFLRAAEGHDLIVVTRFPGDRLWIPEGTPILVDDEAKSHFNMYWQLLRACKEAKTDFIATAEDDVLYTSEHYNDYRPSMDTIGYDMSRWSLYYWTPVYSIKQRISNSTLIAPRLEYIAALEERLAKMSPDHPELISEVGRYEKNLGVTPRKIDKFYSSNPVVMFNHPESTDHVAKSGRKRLGQIKATSIPVWGEAANVIAEYR